MPPDPTPLTEAEILTLLDSLSDSTRNTLAFKWAKGTGRGAWTKLWLVPGTRVDPCSEPEEIVVHNVTVGDLCDLIAAAARENARLRNHLSGLLARVHRDGGHYEQKHGTDKARWDADEIVANLTAENAGLREERDAHNAARQRQMRTQDQWYSDQADHIAEMLIGRGIETYGVDKKPIRQEMNEHPVEQVLGGVITILTAERDHWKTAAESVTSTWQDVAAERDAAIRERDDRIRANVRLCEEIKNYRAERDEWKLRYEKQCEGTLSREMRVSNLRNERDAALARVAELTELLRSYDITPKETPQ